LIFEIKTLRKFQIEHQKNGNSRACSLFVYSSRSDPSYGCHWPLKTLQNQQQILSPFTRLQQGTLRAK